MPRRTSGALLGSPPPSPPHIQPENNHHDDVNENGGGDNFPGEDGAAREGIRGPAPAPQADKQDDDDVIDEIASTSRKVQKKGGVSKKSSSPATKATLSVKLKKFNRPRSLIRDIKKPPSSSSARKSDKAEKETSPLPQTSTKSSKRPSIRNSSAATLYHLRPNPKSKSKKE